MGKVVAMGALMGAGAAGVFHQGTLFLLFHHVLKVPGLVEVLGRPAAPGWDLMLDDGRWGVPLLLLQMGLGALWGVGLAALVRWLRAPDLLTGAALGAVGVTAAALAGWPVAIPPLPDGTDQGLLRAALANAAWGWGTALLMRPFEVRPATALRMRHPVAPK